MSFCNDVRMTTQNVEILALVTDDTRMGFLLRVDISLPQVWRSQYLDFSVFLCGFYLCHKMDFGLCVVLRLSF